MTLAKTGGAIYRQITDYFCYEIASGRISPGERIDSIRNLALTFKVNPNTIQKALQELERDGLVQTDSTNGKFITTSIERVDALRLELLTRVSTDFIEKAKGLNLSQQEIIEEIKRKW